MNEGRPVIVIQTTIPTTLEAFFRAQLRWLQERGFEVHVVSSPGEALSTFAEREGVSAHAIEMSRRITPFADLRSFLSLVRLYRRLRPNIVHGFTPKAGILAMLASWMTGVPARVYSILGVPPTTRGVRNRLMYAIERLSCALAHTVFCECDSILQLALINRLTAPAKTSVLAAWNWQTVKEILVRFPSHSEDRRRLREELRISNEALVLGFVGRLVPDKGMRELLDTQRALANEFPNLFLLLVGEEELDHPLSPVNLKYLKTTPRVLCVGFQKDVASYLAAMDVLVHPSYREGLPTVPLEASAMALPVVITNIPGCVDAVQDGVTGILVPPRDSVALTDAVRRLLLEPELRRRMGEAGRHWALQECNPMKTWEVLLDRYRVLCSTDVS